MTSLKRWRQIGQGQFHKWETPGEEFEGMWRGMHDGRFGPLGTLETPEGLVTFPLHAALLERLKLVREGAEVLTPASRPPKPAGSSRRSRSSWRARRRCGTPPSCRCVSLEG